MRILNLNTGLVHDVTFDKQGENRSICPNCSHTRRNKKDKCLSFDTEKAVGYCHHCDSRFIKHKPHEVREFKKPIWENFTGLTDKQVKWFSERLIGQETLLKMGVSFKKEYFPQVEKEMNAICFPFKKNNEIVNIKFRDSLKNFKLSQGAELIWYNYDALLNFKEIIIVEGEIDALSFIEEGFENVISVPNGASAARMEYLDSSIELFENIEKVYIAVDVDEKGIRLRDELIRRIGAEKCLICGFSEFKDVNEYLCHKGRKSLSNVLKNAKEIEIEGVVNLKTKLSDIENLFQYGTQKGKTINQTEIDELISFEKGRLLIITGTPSSGKSEFVDFILTKLNILHNWKVCYWSPENYPLQYHYSKIAEKLNGKSFKSQTMTSEQFWNTYEFISKNFFWIDPEEPYLDKLLELFKWNVKKYGIDVVLIDPFANMYDEIDYKKQGKMLTKMSMFARQMNVLFVLVAHPRKLEKDKAGHFPMPTMYDISGSADFWNRADYGISVRREQDAEDNTFQNYGQIAIQKVKYKHMGKQGVIEFKYNYNNGRYETNGSNINHWDNGNWLDPKEKDLPRMNNEEDIYDECPF